MKKIVRLTESDLVRIVKRAIRESKDELDELLDEIDTICDEYQYEVKIMVKTGEKLDIEDAKEILSNLKDDITRFLEESSHDEMSDDDFFDLEDYASDCISNFISFLNEHTD